MGSLSHNEPCVDVCGAYRLMRVGGQIKLGETGARPSVGNTSTALRVRTSFG